MMKSKNDRTPGLFSLLATVSFAIGCGAAPVETSALVASELTSSASSTSLGSLSIQVPSGVDYYDVAFGTTDQLRLHERVSVLTVPHANVLAYADVTNTGHTPAQDLTDLGAGSRVGKLTSISDLKVENGAQATVVAYSGSLSVDPSATLGSAPIKDAGLTAAESTWDPQFVTGSQSAIVYPGQTQELAPGAYSAAVLYPGAKLAFRSGTYFFSQIDFEQGSSYSFDTSAGPIFIYVQTSLVLRGATQNADAGRILFGYLGQLPVTVESGLDATLVAPSAPVRLGITGKQLSGAVFAKILEVDPDVRFTHKPFQFWGKLLGSPPLDLHDPPINLKATRDNAQSVSTDGVGTAVTPTTFQIPTFLPVESGNAGNGTSTLSFTDSSNTQVTCSYKGGSATAHPTNDVDAAKGLRFDFVGCSNGLQAGLTASGTHFTLHVQSGDGQWPVAITTTAAHLGAGCSTIPSPVPPGDVALLRHNFRWQDMPSLKERNPAGLPALFYTAIYVETEQQLRDLDQLNVLWDMQPLMLSEIRPALGRCGIVERATDRKGMIVWAIVPAATFNLYRKAGIYSDAHGIAPPFRLMLPYTLDEATAPGMFGEDGSFKYEALGASGYARWLDPHRTQQPSWLTRALGAVTALALGDPDVVSDVLLGELISSSAAKLWADLAQVAAEQAQNLWEDVQKGLAYAASVLEGSVKVSLDLKVINRDSSFAPGSVLRRGWGPLVMTNPPALPEKPILVPHSATAQIKQWGLGFVPIETDATIGSDGHVEATAVQDTGARDGGLCIKLDADAGTMTSFLAPDYFCDFEALDFHHFRGDVEGLEARTNNGEIYAFTQVVDGNDYHRAVLGKAPARAQILTGTSANDLTKFITAKRKTIAVGLSTRAITPCLGFPSIGQEAVTLISTGLGAAVGEGLGAIVGPGVVDRDIWFPTDDYDSRGIMTHEYGHFTMCSLLYDEKGASALAGLAVIPFKGESADSDEHVLAEAWADTFASQVAGGTNYFTPDDAVSNRAANMAYCTRPVGAPTELPCVEKNFKATGDADSRPYEDAIAQWATLFVDAFDTAQGEAHNTNQPYFDIWDNVSSAGSSTPPFLVPASTAYMTSHDENVSIGGTGWRTWSKHWVERGVSVSKDNVVHALVDTMKDSGANWCSICELFAIHDGSFAGNDSVDAFGDRYARWQHCAAGGLGSAYLGTAPDPHLNLDDKCTPCAARQFALDGRCTACADGTVPRGNHCETCPSGTVPGDDDECHACPDYQIAVGNQCVHCPLGKGADRASNTCIDCTAVQTVDFRSIANTCDESVVFSLPPTTSSVCPGETWVELDHLGEFMAGGGSGLELAVAPVTSVSETECKFTASASRLYEDDGKGGWIGGDLFSKSGFWQSAVCAPDGGICTTTAQCTWSQRVLPASTIQAGLDRARFEVHMVDSPSSGVLLKLPANLALSRMGATCDGPK